MHRITSDQVVALPGTCLFCPGSVRREFIDTGIQIEWYGAVILCEECVTSMAQMFGMLTRLQVKGLNAQLAQTNDIVFELKRQLAALEGVQYALAAGGWVAPDSPDRVAVSPPVGEGPPEGAPSGQDDLGTQGGAAPEQVHDEDVAGLRSNAVLDGLGPVLRI